MRKSPWKHLAEHPPALVRLYARRRTDGQRVAPLSIAEISIASGLANARVREITQKTSWEGVSIAEAERFIAGCGFDPLSHIDRNRQRAYARACKRHKTQFRYLKSHPNWKTEFEPLIFRLRSARSNSTR